MIEVCNLLNVNGLFYKFVEVEMNLMLKFCICLHVLTYLFGNLIEDGFSSLVFDFVNVEIFVAI